jgi:hypothetical protein
MRSLFVGRRKEKIIGDGFEGTNACGTGIEPREQCSHEEFTIAFFIQRPDFRELQRHQLHGILSPLPDNTANLVIFQALQHRPERLTRETIHENVRAFEDVCRGQVEIVNSWDGEGGSRSNVFKRGDHCCTTFVKGRCIIRFVLVRKSWFGEANCPFYLVDKLQESYPAEAFIVRLSENPALNPPNSGCQVNNCANIDL